MVNLDNGGKLTVYWIGPNRPQINVKVEGSPEYRLTLSKLDVQNIAKELMSFLRFYEVDFSPENINKTAEDIDD